MRSWVETKELQHVSWETRIPLENAAQDEANRDPDCRFYRLFGAGFILSAVAIGIFFRDAGTMGWLASFWGVGFVMMLLQGRHQSSLYKKVLRRKLLENGIMPACCFECKLDLTTLEQQPCKCCGVLHCPKCGTVLLTGARVTETTLND